MFDKKTLSLLFGMIGLLLMIYFMSKIINFRQLVNIRPYDTATTSAQMSPGIKKGFSDLLK